jgi:hypothetical protein
MQKFPSSRPFGSRHRISLGSAVRLIWPLLLLCLPSTAQNLTLEAIVTPSTVVEKDGRPVVFAIHGFIGFKSLSEVFPYIDSQTARWKLDPSFGADERQKLGRELLRRAVESRVVSMADERPLELLLTHTEEELRRALTEVKEPTPSSYADAFLEVQKKWKHSLNCWSASPSIAGRVLSNWYPIEEGIELYGATYDTTEHFWQGVKYYPDLTIGQISELLIKLEQKDWAPWLARLDDDPKTYLPNAYAVEFLRHNLALERLRWFRAQLGSHGLRAEEGARTAQQRGGQKFRFSAFEEKVIWGDLADLLHLIYQFSADDDPLRRLLADSHFDCIYLGDRRMGFISEEFRSLMLEIWRVKYLQMPRFREVIASIPMGIRLEHFLNDGDSPDIPIPVYVGYLNQIRDLARAK